MWEHGQYHVLKTWGTIIGTTKFGSTDLILDTGRRTYRNPLPN